MTSFTIILPTIGRDSLAKTLISIHKASFIHGVDQLILVADGMKAGLKARECIDKLPVGNIGIKPAGPFIVLNEGPYSDFGHTPRNKVMSLATGEWLLSIDDDDGYREEALNEIRLALSERTDKVPHIFKMRWIGNQYLWKTKEIKLGNVSTQMFCVPNIKEKLGTWGSKYEGDLDFIRSTMNYYEDIVWREEVIVDYCCE